MNPLAGQDPLSPPLWPVDRPCCLKSAALCWAGFGAVVAVMLAGWGDAFDAWGLHLWRKADLSHAGPAWVLEGVRDVTALGGVTLRVSMTLAAAAVLLWLRCRREAIVLTVTVAGGWAFNTALKWLFSRERPSLVPHLTEAGGHSFPSGHSFNSAAGFIAMALAFAALSPYRGVRLTLIGGALALSALIAFSRVMLGVHYPTDILAGWLGGAGWAFLACALLHRPQTGFRRDRPPFR